MSSGTNKIKKKVIVISPLFYPHVGGVEKHVLETSKILNKEFDIEIFTAKHHSKLLEEESIDGIKVFRFTRFEIKYFGLLLIWLSSLKRFKYFAKADIIHVHDVFIWYLPLRLLFFNKPTYVTFHGWEGQFPIPKKNVLFRKIAAKLTNGNIAVGKYIAKYYGISSNFYTYGGVDASSTSNRRKKKNLIVFLGRLSGDTGVNVFLQAIPKFVQKSEIVFCGDGDLRKDCEKYGEVLGFVNPEFYISRASIVFASGYLSILESLANKCLVFVLYNNDIRKDIIEMTPFYKYILSSNDPVEVAVLVNKYHKGVTHFLKKYISKGKDWTKYQNWNEVAKLYKKIWT